MILALALSPSLDVTYEVERLRIGDVTRPEEVTRVAGGKALNAARVAHTLGADVHAIVALGGATGQQIVDLLAADGVEATVVAIAAATRTCIAVVEDAGGSSSTDLYEPASPLTAEEWDRFTVAALSSANSDWVLLSGSVPPGIALEQVAELLRQFASRGRRIALDSSGDGLRTLAPVAHLVKINRTEANEFLGRNDATAAASAVAMHSVLGCDVVITDGARGGSAIIDGSALAIPAPRSVGRFSAGSGDAFLGGLIAAFTDHQGPSAALDRARSAAERNATVAGPGVLPPPLRDGVQPSRPGRPSSHPNPRIEGN